MNVLVLLGSHSSEREVSLSCGAAVAAALETAGHTVRRYDPADGWLELGNQARAADVVFPVLHGQYGEDGFVQTLLDETGVPYVGSGAAASRLCIDKLRTKAVLARHGLPVPAGRLVARDDCEERLSLPASFILKPIDSGSSLGVMIVRDRLALDRPALDALFARHTLLLMEELVLGDEITVGVLDGRALPVVHIIPPSGGEFDYASKYNGTAAEVCPATSIPESVQRRARASAEQASQALGVRDLCRLDMMIDRAGSLFILEANTMPGMTDQSLFPKAARAAGLDMPALCDKLVRLAAGRA